MHYTTIGDTTGGVCAVCGTVGVCVLDGHGRASRCRHER